MRVWLALLSLVALVAASPAAELRPSGGEVRAAVQAVVEAQLAALRRGDWVVAHGYASAAQRARLGPPGFARMLQQSYAEIWRNERATFALVRDDGVSAAVTVRVSGAAGAADFDYGLVREPDGWRINSVVRRLQPPSAAL